MNVLSKEKQSAVLATLVEGNGIRATARICNVNRETVGNVLMRAGKSCASILDERMRDLPCERIQVDEVWTFVGKKQRHFRDDADAGKHGDFWCWTALDQDTKLVPSHRVGKRSREDGMAFMQDLASRLRNRVQLSSDGLSHYAVAVQRTFGITNIDYATIVKVFTSDNPGPGRYSPPAVASVTKTSRYGEPRMAEVTTSHVERWNLSLRMSSSRFARLTLNFSKSADALRAAVALHVAHHNYCRPHITLKGATPAQCAGIEGRRWEVLELLA